MSPKMKKALSALFIVLSVAAVFCIAFGNTELTDAWEALRRLDPGWLVGLVGCWAALSAAGLLSSFLTSSPPGTAFAGKVFPSPSSGC